MPRPRSWTALVGVIAGLALLLGRAVSEADDPVSPAIRTVLDRQVADWNKHDLDGFLEGYWRSPKVVFLSGGERSEGWDAMRARYRKRYQGEGKEMGRLEFSGVEIEPLGPSSASRGRWELTLSDGSKPGGLFTVILRKLPEGWKIVHDHTSAAERATPAQSRPDRKP